MRTYLQPRRGLLRLTVPALAPAGMAPSLGNLRGEGPGQRSGFRRWLAMRRPGLGDLTALVLVVVGCVLASLVPLPVSWVDHQSSATAGAASSTAPVSETAAAQAKQAYQGLPPVFEANAGQSSAEVRYLTRAGHSTLFLSETAATLGSSLFSVGYSV